jgi:hypothetical protein
MADLEAAADVALVKTKDLSAHIDKAEAAFTALEEALEDVKTQFATDWAALDETARVLLDLARAQTTALAAEGEEARQGLTQLHESLPEKASEWDVAIESSRSETSALGAHVSEQEPVLSQAGRDAQTAAQSLAERAAAIQAQLQQALADVRELLETGVTNELKEMQEAVRERAAALQASLAEECETALAEALNGWEQQLAQVEQVIDEEFASARQHAHDVVEFSLEECRRGHEEAWVEIQGLVSNLEGLLLKLGETVGARTAEVGERRAGMEQALSDAATAVERMRLALTQELETMARYEFVRA